MDKEKKYSEMTVHELVEDYLKSLRAYRKWIDKEIDVNDGWVDEIEFMSFFRGELHKIIEECEHRNLKVDIGMLKKLDARWQKWIIDHNDPEFRLEHLRENKPKSHWWEWIDQLDTLTDEQRKTL